MPDLPENMIDIKGRVDYAVFRPFVQESSLADFLHIVQHPFLIGRSFYACGMHRSKKPGSLTMKFLRKLCSPYLADAADPEEIAQGIFILRSKTGKPNRFQIGRAASNDIILTDSSVSKEHAEISCENGNYYITDLGSTNGTRLEGKELKSGEKHVLVPGVMLSFGKYNFIFTHPMMVYRAFHRDTEN